MRITNRVMNNNLLLNLNRGLTRLDRINNQLGSKKQINVPSDDPVKAGIILRTSTSIREADQYIRNIGSAESWLDAADIVMKDVISVIHRAKELGLYGASSHLDETARKALADEIGQLHDNVLQLANTTHGGRYIFAGQYTQHKPFEKGDPSESGLPDIEFLSNMKDAEEAPITVNPNAMSLNFEIGVGVKMSVNMRGQELFKPIFGALQQLYVELSAPSPNPSSTVLSELDDALDNVLQQVSELGGKQNRVGLAKERMLDLQLNLTQILSEEQDLDYAEAIMELKMEEFAYRTALSVGARIIQPSLVDFLR
ncbi:MAG TPA: flagellar hook-associated protein FlgL [Firmicutes bacterium]|nr:flagellar hook-associated protein FlgL [Bacillota bacterium]